MKNKRKKLEKGKYIIGVSGGPDSMALLDMCRNEGLQLIVAHMNYQMRESATRDMQIVEAYCNTYGLTFACCMQDKECVGNFQAFAREARYQFYKELFHQHDAIAILLGHHMDDHLETYLMQTARANITTYRGIQEETTIMDCRIIRPLLYYTKEELLTYCDVKHVPYGIDESNQCDGYMRNKIRHQVIEHMSVIEKANLHNQIQNANTQRVQLLKQCHAFLQNWDFSIDALQVLEQSFLEHVLMVYIYKECACYISLKEIIVLRELILYNTNQWRRDIKTNYYMYREYGKLCIDTKEPISYSYILHEATYLKTPYFEVAFSGHATEAVTLTDTDFPITIRNMKSSDQMQMRFGSKKINRWFIDRKIPKKDRKRWPVVENKQGNIILVPKIGCDIAHFSNNSTLFVVK